MKSCKKIISLLGILLMFHPSSVFAMTKTETIYATLNSNGSVKESSVHTELSNLEEGEVVDYSKLQDIVNLNGNETFSRESDKITWKSTGRDIYYQGMIQDALPIQVSTTYYLNGEEIAFKDLKGKSGDVRIHFHFSNLNYHDYQNMYVPFVVDVTTILKNSNYSNISITNGKTVSTGVNTIVSAIASPGLYESTGIDAFSHFDAIDLSFTTTSFSAFDVYFVVTPKLLEEIDVSRLEELDQLTSSLNTLQDGMNQVEEGSKKLLSGNQEIASKSKMLSDNIGLLSNGMNTLNDNIQNIAGTVSNVTNEVMMINHALEGIDTNSISLTEEEFNALPESVRNTLSQMMNIYATNEEMMISLKELNLSLQTTYDLYGLNREEADIRAELSSNLDEHTIDLLVNTKKVYELKYDSNEELIQRLHESLKVLLVGENGILNTVNYYLTLVQEGANQLSEGSNTINSGLNQIYDGSKQLADALNQVSVASDSLCSGISKINEEGIHKLSNLGRDANYYASKIEELVQLSSEYHGFSSDNVDQTIFIYKLNMK